MPKAVVGNLEMYYELRGPEDSAVRATQSPLAARSPLVMIMGLSANADWWDPETVAALSRDFKVLVFDNRDSGRTTGPAAPYTIKDMAADTAGLMDRVGIEKAHVLGLSMGGMIAQELALNYPEKVDRLILGCTTPGVSKGVPPTKEAMAIMLESRENVSMTRLARGLLKVLFAPGWVWRNLFRLPRLLARLGSHPIRPDAYQRQLQAIAAFDAADRLGRIKARTLVLHGDHDILLPPENARVIAGLVPGAKLVIFRGCAHGFNAEKPREFVRVVREFLLEDGAAERA